MRIALINPPRLNGKIPVIREDRCEVTDRYAIIPPYSLLWLGSILEQNGHQIILFDANGANITFESLSLEINAYLPEICIFRFTPTTFDWDMKTAEIVKKLSKKIFTVAICYTLYPLIHEVMERCPDLDFYLPRNWDTKLLQLITLLDEEKPISTITDLGIRKGDSLEVILNNNELDNTSKIKEYPSLPIPAYHLLKSFNYYRPNTPVSGNFMVIYTSKGCPFQCIYCTVANTPFYQKSSNSVIEEITELYERYEVRLISFFDETFTINRQRTIEICKSIKSRFPALHWYCNTRVNLVDPELLSIMYDSGCRGISFGVESGSQHILNNIKKGITIEEAKKAISWAKNNNLKVYTSFIFGLPGETPDTVRDTMNFIRETLPHGAQFNVAVPYPGTVLYQNIKDSGLIMSKKDWTIYYQHQSQFPTEKMSVKDIENARKSAYKGLYFYPPWILQNIKWVFLHPEDFKLGLNYAIKCVRNFFWYKMEHAH